MKARWTFEIAMKFREIPKFRSGFYFRAFTVNSFHFSWNQINAENICSGLRWSLKYGSKFSRFRWIDGWGEPAREEEREIERERKIEREIKRQTDWERDRQRRIQWGGRQTTIEISKTKAPRYRKSEQSLLVTSYLPFALRPCQVGPNCRLESWRETPSSQLECLAINNAPFRLAHSSPECWNLSTVSHWSRQSYATFKLGPQRVNQSFTCSCRQRCDVPWRTAL